MHNEVFSCDAVILGKLTRDTIVNRKREIFLDQPGGNLLYTAYGFSLWGKTAGLVAKVGCDCPDDWIENIAKNSFNTLGITRNLNNYDSRGYFLIEDDNQVSVGNPHKYFSENNLALPKALLGFESNPLIIDDRKKFADFTVRPEDFPEEYLDSRYLALCPVDFLTHNMIPGFFRSRTEGEVFIHASQSYTQSSFFYEFPSIVNGSSMVLVSEENSRRLFLGKLDDIWIIAEALASYGIEIVIISKINGGYYLFMNSNKKKYLIPPYPVNVIDPFGTDDAFFGGFFAGYLTSFDPKYASIIGSVTASVNNEGSTPEYLLGVFKDLLQARVEDLSDRVMLI